MRVRWIWEDGAFACVCVCVNNNVPFNLSVDGEFLMSVNSAHCDTL